jgi:hypothetical protein
MSMTFYCYRSDYTTPVGCYGPLTEIDDMYHFGGTPRTVDPTREQELEAGLCYGPNYANANAIMIVRSLCYEPSTSGAMSFEPAELLGRVTLARAMPPVLDDGQPDVTHGNMTVCGVRPGYFVDAYEQIAAVCEQAIEWNVGVVLA